MGLPASSAGLFLRTIRYLKPVQLVYQVWQRGQTLSQKAGPGTRRTIAQTSHQFLDKCAAFLQRAFISREVVKEKRFTFLNETFTFGGRTAWRVPEATRLWRYNLHYFDYLLPDLRLDWHTGESLMKDWIDANPQGAPDAWDPFPTSLRIVNWIKFLDQHGENSSFHENAIVESLLVQALHLERRLEFHLLGNHLFKNIKALLLAGLFFKGEDAARWLKKGLQLLERELKEQVLEDGGHFERSPMYHAMVLEDVLDLINVLPGSDRYEAPKRELEKHARRMVGFLCAMTHPDGDIALFNDAAFGIEHRAETLRNYFFAVTGGPAPLPQPGPLVSFPESGYFIMSPSDGDRMIIDCGPVGPDYQPGHAHCDTLSFELTLGGRRVIVDSGCCQYTDGFIRQYNRGNDGHNTLTLDGRNQSEVWGAHRCARRAYPRLDLFREEPDGTLVFKGAHDGYRRLPGKPIHERTISWQGGLICIDDVVSGRGRHRIGSGLHLHPDLKVKKNGEGVIISDDSRALAHICAKGGQAIEIREGWYCPEFNRKLACRKLVTAFDAELPAKTGWEFNLLEKR